MKDDSIYCAERLDSILKIAFWSGVRSSGGVTGNLAAISAVYAYYFDTQILLSSNHFSNHRLEDCFFGNAIYQPEGRQHHYCYCYGEPEYFRILWEEQKQHNKRQEMVTDQRLRFGEPLDMYETTLFREEQSDYLYLMDVSGKNNRASKQALEEADAVVIFLPQEMDAVDHFFKRYSSLIPKSIFLINKYQKRQKCTPHYISKKYGIERHKISVIPQNRDYAQACEIGRADAFIKENLFCKSENKNHDFISHIKLAAEMLMLLEKGEI